MTEVQIITPPGMFGSFNGEHIVATAMRVIGAGFGADGEHSTKYGTDFENDVFMMKRFCWCEKAGECPWCTGCAVYQDEGRCQICARLDGMDDHANRKAEFEKADSAELCDYAGWRGIFSRFSTVPPVRDRRYWGPPNFWFKPTNFALCWYKYIGRDMTSNHDQLPGDFLETVFASHPTGRTLAEAVDLAAAQEEESRRAWREAFSIISGHVKLKL